MAKNKHHIGIVVLGCDKNTADAERFAGMLEKKMGSATAIACPEDPELAKGSFDGVVIFTCAFIHDAKQESVETILKWAARREGQGDPRRIYVVGCLSERYARDLSAEIPEVDAFLGIKELESLPDRLARDLTGPACRPSGKGNASRKRLDGKPYAFLKIGDGCDHACTFCIIPSIKGRLRSEPRETLLAEAKALIASGARELNLVAQDCTAYGRDLYDSYRLPELLADLCALPGDFWVRCLYCYPGGITDALLEQIATQPKVVPYLDMPLQHVAPRVLKTMKRPADSLDIAALVARIRNRVPGIVLRTTMMTGFPGETPADHQALLEALASLKIEWLGAFIYSPEEGTPAAAMAKKVGSKTAARRFNAVMEIQASITEAFNQSREGSIVRALIEGYDEERQCWRARSAAEAPEVDGTIFVNAEKSLVPGQFVRVRLLRADLYDTIAEPMEDS